MATGILYELAREHADAKPAVEAWVAEVTAAQWRTPEDVKARYPSASFLRNNRVVFNLKGNNYRLDTQITYGTGIVLIMRAGTHTEYDRWTFD